MSVRFPSKPGFSARFPSGRGSSSASGTAPSRPASCAGTPLRRTAPHVAFQGRGTHLGVRPALGCAAPAHLRRLRTGAGVRAGLVTRRGMDRVHDARRHRRRPSVEGARRGRHTRAGERGARGVRTSRVEPGRQRDRGGPGLGRHPARANGHAQSVVGPAGLSGRGRGEHPSHACVAPQRERSGARAADGDPGPFLGPRRPRLLSGDHERGRRGLFPSALTEGTARST